MTRSLLQALPFLVLAACSDPIDPGPTPVGPVVVTVGGERRDVDREAAANAHGHYDVGTDPGDRYYDVDTEPAASDRRRVADHYREQNLLPDPPTSTLRAPADPRIEEVDSRTGLPPIR
jgi:hypothetical protein